jgi:hypothetical protein
MLRFYNPPLNGLQIADGPEPAEAIAAAEVVAALKGSPAEDLPEEITDWVKAERNSSMVALGRSRTWAVAEVFNSKEKARKVG